MCCLSLNRVAIGRTFEPDRLAQKQRSIQAWSGSRSCLAVCTQAMADEISSGPAKLAGRELAMAVLAIDDHSLRERDRRGSGSWREAGAMLETCHRRTT